jgi:nitrogen fixation protein FixH
VEADLLNLFWPRPRRRDVHGVGTLGRVIHWFCVVIAVLCALMALEFAVEGWAGGLSRNLVIVAVILTLGSRGILYMLARE